MSRWIRVVLVAVVVAVLAGAAWWWRHPEAFHPATDEVGMGMGSRLQVGEPLHIGMADPLPDQDGTVTLRDVEAHVLEDTSETRISFSVCHLSQNASISSVDGSLDEWCSEVEDVAGAELPLDRGRGVQLLMTIEGAQEGELRIEGADLAYSLGPQSGTQRVGQTLWFRYRGAASDSE